MALHRSLVRTTAGLLGSLGLLAACTSQSAPGTPSPSGNGGTGAAAVSFKTDVAPLFSRSCAGCHSAGTMGERNLKLFDAAQAVDYAAAKAEIGDIIRQVETGRMPKGRAALSASEVALLKSWQSAGTPHN